MQEAEAEDEVEARVETVECEGIHPSVLDLGAEQAFDRVKALAACELHSPAISHPLDVLLVVDGEHPRRPARLGEEAVEAVEGANVEDRETVIGGGDRSEPVAVITSHTRRVDAVLAVESEGVEPKRHRPKHTPCLGGNHLDRQLISDLAFRRPYSVFSDLVPHLA